ncbi:hypothetical protein D7D25_02480 [Proteiniphilum sp. X52]|nr:hypothetical protein D7D25_02480 [Proteiniphilum sp. X52]
MFFIRGSAFQQKKRVKSLAKQRKSLPLFSGNNYFVQSVAEQSRRVNRAEDKLAYAVSCVNWKYLFHTVISWKR